MLKYLLCSHFKTDWFTKAAGRDTEKTIYFIESRKKGDFYKKHKQGY